MNYTPYHIKSDNIKYLRLSKISHGGFGTVYKAQVTQVFNESIGLKYRDKVAIKIQEHRAKE
jgi:serine/threonine protein kinase